MAETNICRKLKKGEKFPMQSDRLLTIKWQDANDVYTLSPAHKATDEAPASRVA
jgi:hypothetical protein